MTENGEAESVAEAMEAAANEIVASGTSAYVEQFNKAASIQSKLKNQLRIKMMELENEFHRAKLAMTIAHEAELQLLSDRHTAAMNELGSLLNRMAS